MNSSWKKSQNFQEPQTLAEPSPVCQTWRTNDFGIFMTVEELIEKLKEFPPDSKVKVYDDYWGERIDPLIDMWENEIVFYTDRR